MSKKIVKFGSLEIARRYVEANATIELIGKDWTVSLMINHRRVTGCAYLRHLAVNEAAEFAFQTWQASPEIVKHLKGVIFH
nr:hypothetical protein [uncultured Rhodopila sp.]